MIWSLLRRELELVCRSALRILERSVSRGMGCFFACFRSRDDRHRPPPHFVSHSATRSNRTEVVLSQNRLSSLFLAEEKEDSSRNDGETIGFKSPQNHKELKDEAKFLKACGTLVETPVEIRKASGKLKGSTYGRDSEAQKFHSWLPNTPIKKIQLDDQPDQSLTPLKSSEHRREESPSQEMTPSSCISSLQNTERVSSTKGNGIGNLNAAVEFCASETENMETLHQPWDPATAFQSRNKAVRFECDYDASSSRSSSENVSQNPKKSEPRSSPYPTPLKLSDEMQTPGTVFTTNLENLPHGRPRIRSQYVYSVPNSVEGDSEWKALKEENSNSHQLSDDLRESLESLTTLTPRSEGGVNETSSGKELKVEGSLSDWLKPRSSTQDAGSTRKLHFGRTPGDRPIIGIVAAHWNDDEPSHTSPKWWDGNGIPNSTNKYKEDQKVSWHATPFEERLEKALSEEGLVSQRKDIYGKPIAFDENEECDTALSQLQSSTNPKSVVSF